MTVLLRKAHASSPALPLIDVSGLGRDNSAAFGLASILAASDRLLAMVRYLGSAYLVWLGLRMITDAGSAAQTDLAPVRVGHGPLARIMWQSVLVELLNPKTVLFFALFLPPFVAADPAQQTGTSVTLQLLILGALVPLTAVPSDLLVALLGGRVTETLNRNRKARVWFAWAGGLILIGIAVSLSFSPDRPVPMHRPPRRWRSRSPT